MDRREELRRKLERIEREEMAKRERPPEQGEASAPSTETASASMPPAPSLTTEQIQEITRGEIEKALREERAARQEESACERARTEARLDELSRGLTDTNEHLTDANERVSTLREDTRASLIPMAREIAELRSRQNGRALPPARGPRNVTSRPKPRPTALPPPITYPPRSRPTEPPTQSGTLERTSYQPPRTYNPPTLERTYETEPPTPLLMAVWALIIIMLLILAGWGAVAFLWWAWLNPWAAAAVLLAAVIILGWMAAVFLTWVIGVKPLSITIVLAGVLAIFVVAAGYTTYQSLTEPEPDIYELGR